VTESESDIKSKSSMYNDYFSTDHLRSGLKTRALRGASITVVTQVSTFAIQTLGTIILARLLGPREFGLVTMVLSFSLLLQGFGVNGFVEATVQREEIHHRQISTLFWINIGLSLILMLLFMASAPLISWFYKEPLLKPIVVAMGFTILFGGLSTQHQALLIRNMKFGRTSAYEMGAAIISITLAIILAIWGWGYWALVAKWLVSPLVIAIGAWLFCRWRPGLPARGTGVGPMLKFAFHTYGNHIMAYFRRNVDKILIGRSVGSQSLGYYDRAYHLSMMLPNQLLSPIANVAMATFSRLSKDPEKYCYHYLTLISIISFVCMPLSGVLTLTGRDLILLLLGPHWNKAGEIFSIFGVSIGVMIIYSTHAWLHLSLGTPDRWFRYSIIAFVMTVLFFAIGLRFGALGVAIAYSASYYVLIGPALWYAGRPVHLKFVSVLSWIWKYFAAALIAGFLCWFILYKYGFTSTIFMELKVLLRILLSTILYICAYLILIMIFYQGIKPISQFFSVIHEMIPNFSFGK
jgi:O-antigen/teichoic acid export membrane protein